MARTKQVRYYHDKSDKKAVIAAAQTTKNFRLYHGADKSLWGDKDVVLAAVASCGNNLSCATPELKADPEVVCVAVASSGTILSICNDNFKADPAVAMTAVKNAGAALKFCSTDLQNDLNFVKAALGTSGSALQYAQDQFKDDKEMVLIAMNANYGSINPSHYLLSFVSGRLRRDREVVLTAIEKLGGIALMHVADEFGADREIVLAAIQTCGSALEYASPALRADREIVLKAVEQTGLALKYASDELRNDRELAMVALANSGDAMARSNFFVLGYVSEALRADRAIALKSVTLHGFSIQYVSDALKADREIVETALKNCHNTSVSWILRYASKELRGDRQLIRSAMQHDSSTLHIVTRELQLDPDIVAMAHDGEPWRDFEDSEDELRQLYLEEVAALQKEMKKRSQLEKFDIDDPNATVQFADRWLSESVEKTWLSGEITANAGGLGGCVEAFAGVKEDLLVASRLLRFASILCYMKKGMEDNHHGHCWEAFATSAKGLLDGSNEAEMSA